MATPWIRPRDNGDVISADISATRRGAKQKDAGRVASERRDVAVNPLQHRDLIEAAIVAGNLLGTFGVESWMRQKPQRTQAQVVADENNPLRHELLAIVDDASESR